VSGGSSIVDFYSAEAFSGSNAPILEVTYTVPATSYTLTGPSSGTVNVASTDFTVEANGESTATVTPHSTGAGSFTPSSITFDGSSDPIATFTYTPTSTTGSPHTISVTNDSGLTDPSSIAYTVNAAPAASVASTLSMMGVG